MENNVLKVITDAMLEKKGKDVVSLDLKPIGTAISDYFVVCNADSTTAVAAIADNVLVSRSSGCRASRMISGSSLTTVTWWCTSS